MKKLVFILGVLVLTACTPSSKEPANPKAAFDPHAMQGMPCHQMGDVYMGDCQFDESGNLIENSPTLSNPLIPSTQTFSTQTDGLPEAKPSEMVELKDGDTYQMTAMMAQQKVGKRVIKRLAYNQQIPGPLLKVPQNATISIVFKNELEVDTTIHSHGLRLKNEFDGVPDVTQPPIKPGETFTYQLTFPDAGVYWYHPHIREDYTQELGLYGNFYVAPDRANYWNPVDQETFLVLDDFLLTESEPAFLKNETTQALMGRFGNIMLINNEENYEWSVPKNAVVRFYLTNVANTRPFNIQIPGARLKLVGGDTGRIEQEAWVDSVVLAPAERVVLEAVFENEGDYFIQNAVPNRTDTMGVIHVAGSATSSAREAFDTLRKNSEDYTLIRQNQAALLDQTPDESITLSIDMPGMGMMSGGHGMGMMHGAAEIEWDDTMPMMNQMATSQNTFWKIIDNKTGAENMDIDWKFKRGDLVKIRVYNDPNSVHPMQHPIHFHGQRFVVLSRNDVPNDRLQWKDTTLIKTGETVDLIVEMSNPGMWMAHCHIAEHLHSGMMLGFTVN
ncbi:multicopper oxidase family protein [Candidatus Peregrinibacteria bacterium]|nr:MAG: multicopper oxidase family protein [Candidatus Peregrinibacteria bacterium]